MEFSLGIRQKILHLISRPNRSAIFVFGLQKSGTSAIAGLLAAKAGKSVTIDTKYFWEPFQSQIISGQLSVEEQVRKYSYPFSKDIIKEPTTTFFIPQLKTYFDLENYVFIVRNPLNNIQSILNRLEIPGDMEQLNPDLVHPRWQTLFKKEEGGNYISQLADLWVAANQQLEVVESNACILVRYEDFNRNKEVFIRELVTNLGLEPQNDITHLLDKAFQPRSKKRLPAKSFFGEKNYSTIVRKCGELSKYYGYSLEVF